MRFNVNLITLYDTLNTAMKKSTVIFFISVSSSLMNMQQYLELSMNDCFTAYALSIVKIFFGFAKNFCFSSSCGCCLSSSFALMNEVVMFMMLSYIFVGIISFSVVFIGPLREIDSLCSCSLSSDRMRMRERLKIHVIVMNNISSMLEHVYAALGPLIRRIMINK